MYEKRGGKEIYEFKSSKTCPHCREEHLTLYLEAKNGKLLEYGWYCPNCGYEREEAWREKSR